MSVLKKINYWAIVPAAGTGKRLGATKPKQYLELEGKPVIAHTLSCLIQYSRINKIVVVTAPHDTDWPSIQTVFSPTKIITTLGGAERHHSVYQGLLALQKIAKPEDWVLVHDAVRPCLQHEMIDRLVNILQDHPVGGLLGIRVRDTLKRTDNKNHISNTLDRTDVWQAQTPQMFRYGLLCNALQAAIEKKQHVTDEAHAIELIGKQPLMVEGSTNNIKITYQEDLLNAECYLMKNSENLLA